MATVSSMLGHVAFPFDGESEIDELDVIGASSSTRSTTVVGDATPPSTSKLDTVVIPARNGKRLLSEREGGIQKKQKLEDKKAVSPHLFTNFRLETRHLTRPGADRCLADDRDQCQARSDRRCEAALAVSPSRSLSTALAFHQLLRRASQRGGGYWRKGDPCAVSRVDGTTGVDSRGRHEGLSGVLVVCGVAACSGGSRAKLQGLAFLVYMYNNGTFLCWVTGFGVECWR